MTKMNGNEQGANRPLYNKLETKKPFYKKFWFYVIAIPLVLYVMGEYSKEAPDKKSKSETILTTEAEETNSDTKKMYQQAPKPRLDYKADTSQIRAELQAKGYNVHKVYVPEDKGGMNHICAVIDTKGNYDKETLAMYRIMFDNAIADFYNALIVDYEFKTSWMFRASKQTLADYFSGKISEQEYIHQVQPIKLM